MGQHLLWGCGRRLPVSARRPGLLGGLRQHRRADRDALGGLLHHPQPLSRGRAAQHHRARLLDAPGALGHHQGFGSDVTHRRHSRNPHVRLVHRPGRGGGDLATERYVTASTWFTQFQAVTKPGSAYSASSSPSSSRRRGRAGCASARGPHRQGDLRARGAAARPRSGSGPRSGSRAQRSAARILPGGVAQQAPASDPRDPERGGFYLVPYSLDGKQARFASW